MRTVEAGDTAPGRRHDRDRAGDRGRQHLQARHPLLGAARRHLPRRGRQRAADRDGQLRDRPGADRRRGDRAGRRRARASSGRASIAPWQVHLVSLARRASAEREAADRLYEELRERRRRGPLRRPRRRAGREADRRRAARLPAADRRRPPRARRGRGRGAASARGGAEHQLPVDGGRRAQALALLERLDELSAGPLRPRPRAPPLRPRPQRARRRAQTREGEPLDPLDDPQPGRLRCASPAIPVFLYLAFDSGDGRTRRRGDRLLADRGRRLPRRLPRPRHRPVQPPGGAARPAGRPPHDPRRRRRLLALRAAAALGAGAARRCASWRCSSSPSTALRHGVEHRGQLAGPDLGLPDHGRDLLRARRSPAGCRRRC